MKTLTKTLFVTLLAVLVWSSAAMYTATAGVVKIETESKSFNKIWVAGNVKIVLTQSEVEGVFVDEYFNADKTSITRKGQTLYVNSMADGQVTIRVSVKDLQRIQASGSAVVVMSNNFDVKYLQVFLSQSAKAKVTAMTGSLYTVVNDDATLKMSGSANEHTLLASNMKNVKLADFVSIKTNHKSPAVQKTEQLVGVVK